MALIENELSITSIEEIFKLKLEIPKYQRPYRWSARSANILFLDIYNAYKNKLKEYRIGSVILHKKEDGNEYDVVDGQQRLTTLSILLFCLDINKDLGLLKMEYKDASVTSILDNRELLKKRVSELESEQHKELKKYILEKCTIVQIVTDEEQEAFQFFDSQNSRGKELAPHDLLKSYHLREMNKNREIEKIDIINKWEDKKSRDLEELFKFYLFPLTQWYKGKNGLGYSNKDIEIFKGVKADNNYNHAIYHKASNIFVEQMNKAGSIELFGGDAINQFQLTQPLVAGKRFFAYTMYYLNLLEEIRAKIEEWDKDIIPEKRTGDIYIKRLYENSLLFFADRFGIDEITQTAMKQLYVWSYSLRLKMEAVYLQTINKYAIGKHERINISLDIFAQISEMNAPEDLNLIMLEKCEPEAKARKNYPEICKFIEGERDAVK